MALIKCENCGNDISEKAQTCPHCGKIMIEEVIKETLPMTCEDCGSVIPDGAESCPSCGCPVAQAKENVGIKAQRIIHSVSHKTKKICICAVAVIALIIGFFVIKNNVLIGNNRIAYELLVDAADNFKNPASVRLVSGTVSNDKDCLYCCISATNGFGARTTAYYYVEDGWADETETPLSFHKKTDELNIELINKKLEHHFRY